ncbi:MAG: gamma-glutamyltransferase [Gammaproteobacteria bacterium]
MLTKYTSVKKGKVEGIVGAIVQFRGTRWLLQRSLVASVFVILSSFGNNPALAQPNAIIAPESRIHPVYAPQAMAVSQHFLASQVGSEILASGGNAVDAAVATGFALAVVLPRAGNLAGGGFMLIHLADSNQTLAIDYREMAPAKASRDMYLDLKGEADTQLSRFSHLSAGVPGTVAGLHYAWKNHGSLPWKKLIAPAIRLADKGFAVTPSLYTALNRARHLKSNEEARAVFYEPDGSPKGIGTTLTQSDLANTLRAIARNGPDAFYKGAIADAIVAEMERGGGLINHTDLANYTVVERAPLQGQYRGYDVVTMPPPSSGGIHLIQILNILEGFDLASLGHLSAASLHLQAEAMKPAYADRALHLGDSDFYPVPVDWLLSKDYAAQLRKEISINRQRPSDEISASSPVQTRQPRLEHVETTHFSIVDTQGNAVSNTYTLNFSFGSGIMVPGTGMLLNNEMDDFSAKPGVANAYGLLGSEANAIAAHKRPLSSMTPTMVFKDGQLRLLTGSPGGSRIITAVLQHLVNMIDYRLNVAEAIYAPRIHHQWQPPQLFHERDFSPDTLKLLRQLGHNLKLMRPSGSLQAIAITEDGIRLGATDPRRGDGRAVGF